VSFFLFCFLLAILPFARIVDLSGELGDGIDWSLFSMLLYQAKGSFKQIYSTEGSDITHLMNSITHLFVMFKKMRFLLFGIIAKNVGLTAARSMGFGGDDDAKDSGESPIPAMSSMTKLFLLSIYAVGIVGLGIYGTGKDAAQLVAEAEKHEAEAGGVKAEGAEAKAGAAIAKAKVAVAEQESQKREDGETKKAQ
jgi:hypothetical protein